MDDAISEAREMTLSSVETALGDFEFPSEIAARLRKKVFGFDKE